jgi:hypothetical protein
MWAGTGACGTVFRIELNYTSPQASTKNELSVQIPVLNGCVPEYLEHTCFGTLFGAVAATLLVRPSGIIASNHQVML